MPDLILIYCSFLNRREYVLVEWRKFEISDREDTIDDQYGDGFCSSRRLCHGQPQRSSISPSNPNTELFPLLLSSFIGKASLMEEFIYHLVPGKIDQKIRYKNYTNQIWCREERKSTLLQEAKFSRKEWSAAMVVTKSLNFEF